MRLPLMLLLIMLCLSNQSCSTPLSPALVHRVIPQLPQARITGIRNSTRLQRRVAVDSARRLLAGKLEAAGLLFEPDPVGFVRAAWWEAGIDLFSGPTFQESQLHGMEILYRSAASREGLFQQFPRPGDLIFLGQPKSKDNPTPSQVALVEFIGADGTIYGLGRFADGPGRIRLDLNQNSKNSYAMVSSARTSAPTKTSVDKLFWSFARPY